uniref:Uncharacterized protein n=1 Tax=viral metagenome TaxID=1070528 RepID=A0A2V0R9E4_9ZZZZ
MTGNKPGLWQLYDQMSKEAILAGKGKAQKPVAIHFGPSMYRFAKVHNADIRLVVLDPDELERRARDDGDPERMGAALHQLANLIHWLNTDGKWENPKLYYSIDSALA